MYELRSPKSKKKRWLPWCPIIFHAFSIGATENSHSVPGESYRRKPVKLFSDRWFHPPQNDIPCIWSLVKMMNSDHFHPKKKRFQCLNPWIKCHFGPLDEFDSILKTGTLEVWWFLSCQKSSSRAAHCELPATSHWGNPGTFHSTKKWLVGFPRMGEFVHPWKTRV